MSRVGKVDVDMTAAPEVMGHGVHIVLENESGRDAPGFERRVSLAVGA